MTKEKLTTLIMKQCAQDGEPVTKEEAEKMAEMEIKAVGIRKNARSETPRKPANRERKVDTAKKHLLDCCRILLEGMGANVTKVKTETEVRFTYEEGEYTIKLIKHRSNAGE